MIGLPSSTRIYLASEPADMRKGIDGLSAQVRRHFGEEAVFSGHLFVFLAGRNGRAKILFWDRGGFVLYYKRLERGRFRLPQLATDADSVTVDATELAMLLDGIDVSRVRPDRDRRERRVDPRVPPRGRASRWTR